MKKLRLDILLKGTGLVICLAVLCLVLSSCGGGGGSQANDEQTKAVRQALEELNTLINNFKLNVGRYPTTEEGLQALTSCPQGVTPDNWKGPYTEQLPVDPWKNQYMYQSPAAGTPFAIFSKGPDGKENTPDDISLGSGAQPAKKPAGGGRGRGEG